MINKNKTSNKQTPKKYFWIDLVSLCQLEKFWLQNSSILTAHWFNLGFKMMRMLWYCLPIYHCGKETSFVVQLTVCLYWIKLFQFCFVKKSSNNLCCIIKLLVESKKKSEAKVGLSMIWPIFRDMTPQVLPQVVSFYWQKDYCLVYTNYYEWY